VPPVPLMRRIRVACAIAVLVLAWFLSIDAIASFRGLDPSSRSWIASFAVCLALAVLGVWLARPLPPVPSIRGLFDRPLAFATPFAVLASWAIMAQPERFFTPVIVLFIVYSLGAPLGLIAQPRWWPAAGRLAAAWLLVDCVVGGLAAGSVGKGDIGLLMLLMLAVPAFVVSLAASAIVRRFRRPVTAISGS
jgi:hypothetical protein